MCYLTLSDKAGSRSFWLWLMALFVVIEFWLDSDYLDKKSFMG